MSAVDNKHLIQILGVKVDSGISKRTQQPWEMRKAQCAVTGPDGSIQVGVLMLPKAWKEDPVPGKYLAEFELGIDFENRIVPVLTKLHSFNDAAKPSPSAPKAS
jgi:hypothetical protein